MNRILGTEALYGSISYAVSTAGLGQGYIPLRSAVTRTQLEQIAEEFTAFVDQKTGERHRLVKRLITYKDQEPMECEVIGRIQKRGEQVTIIQKYHLTTGFVGLQRTQDVFPSIVLYVTDVNFAKPKRPMTLRQEMNRVLEKYIQSLIK